MVDYNPIYDGWISAIKRKFEKNVSKEQSALPLEGRNSAYAGLYQDNTPLNWYKKCESLEGRTKEIDYSAYQELRATYQPLVTLVETEFLGKPAKTKDEVEKLYTFLLMVDALKNYPSYNHPSRTK